MKDTLADLLALCASAWARAQWLKVDPEEQRKVCQQLNRFNVLSISAMASILDVPFSRVERILDKDKPSTRGRLNPRHLSILGYGLSNHFLAEETLSKLVNEGTSINMISKLTLLSKSTIYRRLKSAMA